MHNPSIEPSTTNDGILISTGSETSVNINQVNIQKMSYPYSNCIKNLTSKNELDTDLYKKTVGKNRLYSRKFCIWYCYQKYIFENCQCFDIQFSSYDDTMPCRTDKLNCIFEYFSKFYTNKISECFKECPDECELIKFDLTTSVSSYPSKFYAELMLEKQKIYSGKQGFSSLKHIKETALAIDVNFGDISYLSIEDIPSKSFDQLLSEIGGILGLCMGCSLLSLVEIVELIIEIAIVIFKAKKTT